MEISEQPQLESPEFIASFLGWNDAGQGATTAMRYLIDHWHAKHFASLDHEDYYSFTDTRPTIRIVEGKQRELSWPKNDFYYRKGSEGAPDAVLLQATEPNLRWRSYCGEIIGLAQSLGAKRIVTMGSLVTDAVHTRPVPLTGFATDPGMARRLAVRGITRSSYEGPTGIIGVLHTACIEANMPTGSLWAASPFYLGATPNPKTAYGLLDALDDALGLKLNLAELGLVAQEFERQVTAAVRDNTEIQEQIRVLEQRHDERGDSEPQQHEELPSSGAIIADLENFLRRQRTDGEE